MQTRKTKDTEQPHEYMKKSHGFSKQILVNRGNRSQKVDIRCKQQKKSMQVKADA